MCKPLLSHYLSLETDSFTNGVGRSWSERGSSWKERTMWGQCHLRGGGVAIGHFKGSDAYCNSESCLLHAMSTTSLSLSELFSRVWYVLECIMEGDFLCPLKKGLIYTLQNWSSLTTQAKVRAWRTSGLWGVIEVPTRVLDFWCT